MKEVKAKQIEIVTDRLIIRTPDERDIHDIFVLMSFVLMSDLEIAASTGFRPMSTLSEAEGKIRREMDGGRMFCISEKNHPERNIGVFEITPHRTNTESGEKCNYEICYFLHKEARGKGYMTEVVERMKRYLFWTGNAARIILTRLLTWNIIPSIRKNTSILMKKCAKKS